MNVEIILEIILIGIGLYIALIKSYFQEKGKNIATSEDIEELTLKVESVKQQFLEKNAYLQANLDLLTNLQISHKNDERLALIDFHKKINTWVGLLTEGTPSLLDPFDDQEIQTKIHQYALTYQKVLAAQAVLDLYVEDNKLIEIIIDLKMVIITRLHQPPIIFLLDLKKSNFEISQLDLEENLLDHLVILT